MPNSVAILPQNSEPTTMAPKNTIWCTAMPRARMKLGRIIWTAVPLLAITVIQQAPDDGDAGAHHVGRHGERAISVAAACRPIAQMLARSGPSRRLKVGIRMAPATAPTPNTA